MKTVGVLDYGVGNIQSVANAFDKVGVSWHLITEAREVSRYERLLLPGVGGFGTAMSRLTETGLGSAVCTSANAGTPLLGICLGMQLLGGSSEESPGCPGLGLLDGRTVAIDTRSVSTNTGFRTVEIADPRRESYDGSPVRDYYFNHGYQLLPEQPSAVTGILNWNHCEVVAAVRSHNVMGVQFHPEKSQGQGLAVLRAFSTSGELRL